MEYFLAIDIGASSGRHIIGYRENGMMKTKEVFRFPNGVVKQDGHLTWDTDALLENVKKGIAKAKAEYDGIVSLAIDTWGVDYVLMKGDEEVRPCFAYRDDRTKKYIDELHSAVPFETLYSHTGCQFQSFNSIYQLYADLREGRLEGVTDFLMIPEYIMYKLCGVKIREYTNATTTGMINAKTGEFDADIVSSLGLPDRLFPALTRPGKVVGEYDGIKVMTCATHDTGSAVEGIPMDGDEIYISSGTWSLLGVKTASPVTDDGSMKENYSNEGGVGYNRYLKNIMGMWLINRLRDELCPEKPFADIVNGAEASTFDGLVDANGSAFLSPESMKEAFDSSLDEKPKRDDDYFRCAYRSLAVCYKKAVEGLEKALGKKYSKIYIVGGGAKNDFLNSLTEEYTGKKVIALPIEATSLGNLKIQAEAYDQMTRFESAKQIYAKYGIDAEKAISLASSKPISIHCWQGDDVTGFDNPDGGAGNGIQTTGNYPGKARNFEELKADFLKAASLIPGKKRINLHACYAVFEDGEWVDRDKIEYKHFAPWVGFAKENGFGIDFNPTVFSHPMMKDGLSLSSPDENVRRFWIDHCKACRRIAERIGEELGDNVLDNVWIPDGLKDVPADRLTPRLRLKASLDEIFAEKLPHVIDCVESKVFAIGVESYTVGSNEFYMSYAATHPGVYNLLDNGHYHPTEVVSDKIPSLLAFFDKVPLHVTRGVRWDSDHVVILEDEIKEIMKEIVRNDALDKVLIGLDFFDASINRVAAWVIGARNAEKALLWALLQPHDELKKLQDEGNFTKKLMLMEEAKTLPFGDIWTEYCSRSGVPADESWYNVVEDYEKKVLVERK